MIDNNDETTEIIHTITMKLVDAETEACWNLDREKTDSDDEEVMFVLFGNVHNLKFQNIDDLHRIYNTSVKRLTEIIQDVWNSLEE